MAATQGHYVRRGRGRAAALAAGVLIFAGCAAPRPEVTRFDVPRVPGESIVLARIRIPEAVSGVSGPRERDAVRVTVQAEGLEAVRPIPLSSDGYFLTSLPPGRYRLTGWDSRAGRATQFGPLEVPFEVPSADALYYLGTLSLVPHASERYLLQVGEEFEEAMRYIRAEHPRLAGDFQRRLLRPSIGQ